MTFGQNYYLDGEVPVTFNIEITTGTVELTVDQIWPDGDAPKEPTVQDVTQRILEDGDLWQTADEWFLNDNAELFVGVGLRE